MDSQQFFPHFIHSNSRVGRARAAQPSGEEPRGTGGQGLHPLHRTQGDAAAWRGRNSFRLRSNMARKGRWENPWEMMRKEWENPWKNHGKTMEKNPQSG